jgi:hypothetical protein
MEAKTISESVITVVETTLDPSREDELIDGYRAMILESKPDGLIRSELLRGPDGLWRIQTRWRDMEAIVTMRASGERPAALALLDRLGLQHTFSFFFVAAEVDNTKA